MKIIIAGAGDMGYHLAQLLASERQEITLIDNNEEVLEAASRELDVFSIKGDATSLQVLKDASVESAKLYLAVTTSEKTNILSCILAHELGARQTIARVDSPQYLYNGQRELLMKLGVDHLISPTELAAKEIERLVLNAEVTDNYLFENGTISLNGITIDENSVLIGRTIEEILSNQDKVLFKPIAILRENRTILPRPEIKILMRDHVYFITPEDKVSDTLAYLKISQKPLKNIMILGGSPLARRTAQLLEQTYTVSIIANDKEICKDLADCLNHTLIITGDPSNISLLKEEGLERMDGLLALTPNSEINIIACLTAENFGVKKTMALVENKEYIHISQQIGVDTLINVKLNSANNIFRFVRKGKVEAITSLHGVDAEIIEFAIHKDNQLTNRPLKELNMPKNSLIAAIIRNGKGIIPDDEFVMANKDKVIVFASSSAVERVENMFR